MLCYSSERLSLAGTLCFLGYLLGSLVWLPLSDRWGRKWLLILGCLIQSLALLVFLFKLNVATLYVVLFIVGFKAALGFQLAFIYFIEFVSPQRRNAYVVLINLIDCANMWSAAVIKFGRSWWIVYWMSLGMGLVLIPVLAFFTP